MYKLITTEGGGKVSKNIVKLLLNDNIDVPRIKIYKIMKIYKPNDLYLLNSNKIFKHFDNNDLTHTLSEIGVVDNILNSSRQNMEYILKLLMLYKHNQISNIDDIRFVGNCLNIPNNLPQTNLEHNINNKLKYIIL